MEDIDIGKTEVRPCLTLPSAGTRFYFPSIVSPNLLGSWICCPGDRTDKRIFYAGLMFTNKEDAFIKAKELFRTDDWVTPYYEEDLYDEH